MRSHDVQHSAGARRATCVDFHRLALRTSPAAPSSNGRCRRQYEVGGSRNLKNPDENTLIEEISSENSLPVKGTHGPHSGWGQHDLEGCGKGFRGHSDAIMPFDSAQTVNETTITDAAGRLGEGVRTARKLRQLTQRKLAESAGVDLATVQNLERGRGTLGPLNAVLSILDHGFSDQANGEHFGSWIAKCRKSAGYSQADFAAQIDLSKPTIVQIEHGRGKVGGLLRAMTFLGLAPTLAPNGNAKSGVRIFYGDCLEVMPTLTAGSVDAIIADLPYGSTGLDWDQCLSLDRLWAEFRRLLKPTGAVVLTASQPFTAELVMSNREWFKYALVWEKSRPTGFLHAKQMVLKSHEDILVFSPGVVVGRYRSERQMTYNPQDLTPLERPKPRPNGPTQKTFIGQAHGYPTVQTHTNYPTSVLRFPSVPKPEHPTQKPVDLMRYLVRTFTNPGETVLDCAMGAGTTGVAATEEGRHFIGIEKEECFFDLSRRRLWP